MEDILKLTRILKESCCYAKINELGEKVLRERKNGIDILNVILYKFLYTDIRKTKQDIVSYLNEKESTRFTRQSFDEKENNIPISFYNFLFNEIVTFYNNDISTKEEKLIAVDGTYNNDNNQNIMMNIGLFDITNNIPVNITSYGKNNRNKEVKLFKNYVKLNLLEFNNVIFVADRLYFNYDLLDFLTTNNFKYIIRVKGSGDNLNPSIPLKKSTPNYNIINNLRSNIRLVKCERTSIKTLYAGKNKIKTNKINITVKNDYVLVTNLTDIDKYPDEAILNYYHLRWDIEVFFKFIKSNFKFQQMREKEGICYEKLYKCELIISYIEKILENYYLKNNPLNYIKIKKKTKIEVKCSTKINKSSLVRGIFDNLLYKLFHGDIDLNIIDTFLKLHVVIVKNEINRSFVRNSKSPFSKWYIKGYSELTKYQKVIKAIKNGTTNKLNKNLKTLARRIILIT